MSEPDIKLTVEKGGILSTLIIEIVGAPKEHVEKTMKMVLDRLKEEKGVFVTEGKVHQAKETENKKFFATYSELEVLFDDFNSFVRICYDYMPSNIDILEPAHFKTEAIKISDFINDVLARLHDIDLRLKTTNATIKVLEKNAVNLLKRTMVILLKDQPKDVETISSKTGIKEDQLMPFLEGFEKEGWVKIDGSLIRLLKEPTQ